MTKLAVLIVYVFIGLSVIRYVGPLSGKQVSVLHYAAQGALLGALFGVWKVYLS